MCQRRYQLDHHVPLLLAGLHSGQPTFGRFTSRGGSLSLSDMARDATPRELSFLRHRRSSTPLNFSIIINFVNIRFVRALATAFMVISLPFTTSTFTTKLHALHVHRVSARLGKELADMISAWW
jgi:hypothetical protein